MDFEAAGRLVKIATVFLSIVSVIAAPGWWILYPMYSCASTALVKYNAAVKRHFGSYCNPGLAGMYA